MLDCRPDEGHNVDVEGSEILLSDLTGAFVAFALAAQFTSGLQLQNVDRCSSLPKGMSYATHFEDRFGDAGKCMKVGTISCI